MEDFFQIANCFDKENMKKKFSCHWITDAKNVSELTDTMENFMRKHLEAEEHTDSACKLGQKTCLTELETSCDRLKVM